MFKMLKLIHAAAIIILVLVVVTIPGISALAGPQGEEHDMNWGHGFIRRDSKDPTRLVSDDGAPFYPIGLNRWAVYVDANNRDAENMETYIKNARASGINTLRVFIVENNPDVPMSIEPRLGQYNEAYLERLDQLFELANKYGMYIILALYDHYDLRNFWSSSAYSSARGGPAVHPIDFYTNPVALLYEQKRIGMLVERYTKWANLLAWEPINEANGVVANPPANFPAIVAHWVSGMAEYIKSIDPNKHLVTESLTGDNFWPAVFQSPALDIAQAHIYRNSRNPNAIVNLVNMYYAKGRELGKPLIIGEFGSLKGNPQRIEYIHDGLWAALMNGGSAFLWTHKNDPYGDVNDDILRVYSGLAKVTGKLDWANSDQATLSNSSLLLGSSPLADSDTVLAKGMRFLSGCVSWLLGKLDLNAVAAMGLRLGDQNLIWLRARRGESHSPIVTVTDAAVGTHSVIFLDAYSGNVLGATRETVAGAGKTGKLTIKVPTFKRQIAIIDILSRTLSEASFAEGRN